jgi:UDP-glucose 4-epimerase
MKKLLITGGTGSFGNAVLRRFLKLDEIEEIRIFSRDEKKQDDMRRFYKDDKIKYFIGDVRNFSSIDSAMYGVDMVFHAAALKQVPSCEFFPMEAVRTNIEGTDNIIRSSIKNGVKNTIILSTDKAVYPINAMGISKAMSEKVMVASSRQLNVNDNIVVCGTRYGNVMASRGSVIPMFIQQIKENKPLTITDPEMTRFMMSLDSAVDLVLFAFENGRNGDIFVQKAPACSIETLAKALLELYKAKNQIKIIGTRHGEKKYESLLTREEMSKAEDMGDYYRIPADNRDLNYDKFFVEGEQNVNEIIDYTSDNTKILTIEETKELLLTLLPIRADLYNEDVSYIFET